MNISFSEIILIPMTYNHIMTYLGVKGGGWEVQQVVKILLVARGRGRGRPHHQEAHVAPDTPEQLLGQRLAPHPLTIDLRMGKFNKSIFLETIP